MLSQRILSIPASPIRKLSAAADAARAAGTEVIPLNIGQPDIHTPEQYFQKIRSLSDMPVVAYGSSDGRPELKKAFSDYFMGIGAHITPNDILITTGGSEAISISIATVCDSGDDILIFEPFYANYVTMAKTCCVNIISVTTSRENDFRLPSADDMQKVITNKTKALIVTNPNNPTGTVYSREEIEQIILLAKRNDLVIIADEVYREFIYDGAQYTSFLCYPEIFDRLIIIDSVSKRFSGCGIRIGCMASKNSEIIENALKLCQARLCVSCVEQLGAAEMFKVNSEYIKNAVTAYAERRNFLCKRLSEIQGVEFGKPQGAFYIIAKLPIDNSDDFARYMLSEFSLNGKTVLLCPASDFYADENLGQDEIRISYCIGMERLSEAMDVLEAGIKAYNKKA